MKLLLLLLSIILSLSLIEASVNIKYYSCNGNSGNCACASSKIEGYAKGDYTSWADFKVPDYPEDVDIYIAHASYIPSNKTIVFTSTDSLNHDYLTYPINVDDNSYDVPQCAYVKSSRFSDNSCSYFVVCNDSSSLSSISNLLIFTIISLTFFFVLF